MNYPSLRYQKIQSVVVLAIMNDRRVENSSDMLFFSSSKADSHAWVSAAPRKLRVLGKKVFFTWLLCIETIYLTQNTMSTSFW